MDSWNCRQIIGGCSGIILKTDAGGLSVERICPVCNGLQGTRRLCPYCGDDLEDRGALQEFVDDYSPYLSQQFGEELSGGDECVHLYYCPRCQEDVRQRVAMWTL